MSLKRGTSDWPISCYSASINRGYLFVKECIGLIIRGRNLTEATL